MGGIVPAEAPALRRGRHALLPRVPARETAMAAAATAKAGCGGRRAVRGIRCQTRMACGCSRRAGSGPSYSRMIS
jgi:hypothetical protein